MADQPAPPARDVDAVRDRCTRFLGWHGRPRPREVLLELAAATPDDLRPDHYGAGAVLEDLEAQVAELLAKPAAVFMPSGTMAQQIALRIWSERRGTRTVAFHPTCHLELHEERGYDRLHGLHAKLVGQPHELLRLVDLEELAEPLAALLLELPQRELGGRLPDWDDLLAQTAWARERGIALHLDGARLWEAQPFYGRPHAELAGLFDSVSVSFYKGLGGLAGAALASDAATIAEARVWQRRHGGN
ncbi:MAG: threonine aldolase family protein, partial [Mycobacteriales bacterium]